MLSDNGPKHVSGDVMSRARQTAAATPTDDIDRNHNEAVAVDDDNVSVSSDLSEDFDDIYVLCLVGGNDNLNNVVNHNRRGQCEVANLSPAPHLMSRLRSG